jgi:2'-5' RNA ligase
MRCDPNGATRINSFALVTYIPEPLGSYLNNLRDELVPNCGLNAHVSVLPPRPLYMDPESTLEQIRKGAREISPFRIELERIEVFPVTHVVYIAVSGGSKELRRMHDLMNSGDCCFAEVFEYHPHLTLAQEFPLELLEPIRRQAEQRWAEYPHERSFPVDRVTFVQNTIHNGWIDLADCSLGGG